MAIGTQGLWADAYLKDVYAFDNKYWTAVNHRTPGLDLLSSGKGLPQLQAQEGRRLVITNTIKTNPNAGIGLSETGGLPTGSVSEGIPITYNMAGHYSRCTMSSLLMNVSNGMKQSVMNLANELKLQRTALHNKLGWLVHGDGSGEIGAVDTTAGAATGSNVGVLTLVAYTSLSILFKDAEVIIRNRTTGALFGGLTAGVAYKVTAKANSKGGTTLPTVTIANASTGALPDLSATGAGGAITTAFGLYFYDSQGASIIGLGMSCSQSNPGNWGTATGFYGGIDRSDPDNSTWVPYSQDAGNKGVDIVSHIQAALDNIDELAGDDIDNEETNIVYGFCGYDVFRGVGNQLSADQRTFIKPEGEGARPDPNGGYEAWSYERLRVVVDRFAAFRELRIQNPRTLYRKIIEEVGPVDLGGSNWKMVSGLAGDGRDNDVWTMTIRTYQVIASTLCNGNARIYNLSASR